MADITRPHINHAQDSATPLRDRTESPHPVRMPGIDHYRVRGKQRPLDPSSLDAAFGQHLQGVPAEADRSSGVTHPATPVDQSRRSSLMLVFARVCASTRFTITAQASEGPGEPSGRGLPGSEPGTTTE